MTEGAPTRNLDVGSDLAGPIRVMTEDRLRWYSISMRSSAHGETRPPGLNIHTSEDYAKGQGLPGAIADGMILTNWCQSMLIQYFGIDYIERGELRTKYIKPTFVGDTVFVRGRVLSAQRRDGDATVYGLDIWCENQDGVKITDGDAKIEVRRR